MTSASSDERFRAAAEAEGGEPVSAGARNFQVRTAVDAGRAFYVDLSSLPEDARPPLIAEIKELVAQAMFKNNASLFFCSPRTFPEIPGKFGILYLLRRDIEVCLGINPNNGEPSGQCKALFPGAMAILAGIDLLAKFYCGKDDIREAGKRFRCYLKAFSIGNSPDEQVTIYQLRNSLLHSFGLYSKTGSEKKSNERFYRFHLIENGGPLISPESSERYAINLNALHKDFEQSVSDYEFRLGTDKTLQHNFTNMFDEYGSIYIGTQSVPAIPRADDGSVSPPSDSPLLQ